MRVWVLIIATMAVLMAGVAVVSFCRPVSNLLQYPYAGDWQSADGSGQVVRIIASEKGFELFVQDSTGRMLASGQGGVVQDGVLKFSVVRRGTRTNWQPGGVVAVKPWAGKISIDGYDVEARIFQRSSST
jgi:hypothetical protein